MYKIRFRLGLRPIPYLRSLQGSPDPWLHLRGPISKGRGEGEGRVNEGEKKGRKNEFGPPQSSPQIDATVYEHPTCTWNCVMLCTAVCIARGLCC